MGCDPVHHNRMRCAWSTVRPRGREDRDASGSIASGPAEVYNPVTQRRGAQYRKRSEGQSERLVHGVFPVEAVVVLAGGLLTGWAADRIAASLVEACGKDRARVVFIDTVEVLRENRF